MTLSAAARAVVSPAGGAHRRRRLGLAVLVLAITLTGCSSPQDVSAAERAAAGICEALEPLPGVAAASCVVDDGGFDAGISRHTSVELAEGATAEQAHRVLTTWLSSKEGGRGKSKVDGSRATPLRLTLPQNANASFTVDPGTPAPGIAFVREWLGHAAQGVAISASAGDKRAIRLKSEALSPSEQADLIEEFSLQTRTDGLVLEIGPDSTIESPVPPSLAPTIRSFDETYRGVATGEAAGELEFAVDVFTGEQPRLRFRIPTSMAPSGTQGQSLTETSGWAAIRAILEAASPGGDIYAVSVVTSQSEVIGRFSTSGCEPPLPGPEPRFGAQLQAQWSAIHSVSPSAACAS